MGDPVQSPLVRAQPLIALIYRAAVDPMLWKQFLERLSESLGGPKIGMNLELPGAPIRQMAFEIGSEYAGVFSDYAARRALPWPIDSIIDAAHFVPGAEMFPDAELPNTPFYRDYMAPQGLVPVGPIGYVFGSDGERPLGAIGIYRRQGGRAIDDADVEMLNLLAPHLDQAYTIHCELVDSARSRNAIAEVMDRFPIGVILLNAASEVVATNRAAGEILAARDGFNITNGVLRATQLRNDQDFAELLSKVVRDREAPRPSQAVTIERPSERRPYEICVSGLVGASDSGNSRNSVAVVFISDPETQQLRMPELLAALYGLTLAEAELAALLCHGETLDEAAEIRGVSRHTARSQLKSVFVKAGVSRQSELVGLLLTSVAGLSAQEDAPKPTEQFASRRSHGVS
jgi:DNA-binding CsgD family transcriptional regulator/PAS domain-containing protein